jgi:hypothetical protein
MQLDPKTTWWLAFALAAVQGLMTVSWNTLGLDPKWVALISQLDGYATYLLIFALHGSVPGVAASDLTRKAAAIVLAIGVSVLLFGGETHAQASKRPALTGDPIRDIGTAINQGSQGSPQRGAASNPFESITTDLLNKILVDVTYAQALSKATNNTVTQGCWAAWVDLVTQQTAPVKDASGNVLTEPDPHFFTAAERASEFINQLQPNSALNVGCGAALNASKMAIGQMIGAVLSGGALGLFKLPFGIP